ncbi:hypothetical protein EV122DRAFT_219464 [Schizophyllum commune]
MPYISVTNPTSVYEVLAPQIVTTTIYPSSTASPTSTHPHRQVVPIGAIVGGVCAGAAAACIITAAWILWGRSIKRKQLKERQQAEKEQQLSENTKRNAGRFSTPGPAAGSYRPLFGLPESRKIKFAPIDEKPHSPPAIARPPTPPPPPPPSKDDAHSSPFDDIHEETADVGTPLPPPPPPAPRRTSTPPPLRSTKASRDLASEAKEAPRHSLRSKASAASSASMYSTASGEAHRNSRLFSLPAWDHTFLHPRWSGSSFAANMLPKRERTASNPPPPLPEPVPDYKNIGVAR